MITQCILLIIAAITKFGETCFKYLWTYPVFHFWQHFLDGFHAPLSRLLNEPLYRVRRIHGHVIQEVGEHWRHWVLTYLERSTKGYSLTCSWIYKHFFLLVCSHHHHFILKYNAFQNSLDESSRLLALAYMELFESNLSQGTSLAASGFMVQTEGPKLIRRSLSAYTFTMVPDLPRISYKIQLNTKLNSLHAENDNKLQNNR